MARQGAARRGISPSYRRGIVGEIRGSNTVTSGFESFGGKHTDRKDMEGDRIVIFLSVYGSRGMVHGIPDSFPWQPRGEV